MTRSPIYFLLMLLAGTLVLAFFILRPFLYPLVMAVVFAVAAQPLYRRFMGLARGRPGLAALCTTLTVLLLILVPLVALGLQIVQEAWQLYPSVIGNGAGVFRGLSERFGDGLEQLSPPGVRMSANVEEYVGKGLAWLLRNLGALFSNVAQLLVGTFVFLIAFYYFLKDGHKLKSVLVAMSPLHDRDDEMILQKLETAVNSVVRGNILIALIQGVLSAIGFSLFGVPHAVLWGSVAALSALIPGIGTALVLTPAILFLFATGPLLPAIGLLTWGVLAVGLIDNVLGPKLVGRKIQLHPFLVLLSVLGGVAFFGPVGFLLGPLAVSLLSALFEVYSSLEKNIL